MARLLAEDLLLLCWDPDRGAVHRRCSSTLRPGIGGGLVVDAILAEGLTADDGRARPTGAPLGDPLLGEVLEQAGRGRRPPKMKKLVQRVGTTKRLEAVRDRLVDAGVLAQERRRLLGIIPVTRFPVARPGTVAAVREPVRALLRGVQEPTDAALHHVLLAALAGPTNAVDLLVERSERKPARKRAEAFGEGYGVPEAVGAAVREAQAAAMAAVTAAAAASSSSSSSS